MGKTETTNRPLGRLQRKVLESLEQHGGWQRNCGWLWDTPSNTLRIMDSLVRRGVAGVTQHANPMYRITKAGREIINVK